VRRDVGGINYNELGEGTTVELYLPRAAGSGIDTRDEGNSQPRSAEPRSETILIAEDNDLLSASVATMLREHGFRALEPSNEIAALELLEAEKDVRLLGATRETPSAA
jgi:hypothetical protein